MDATSTFDESEGGNNEGSQVTETTAKAAVSRQRYTTPGFPEELLSFGFGDRQYLICGNEQDPAKENGDDYLEVAQKIEEYPTKKYCFLLERFTVIHLRKLSKQFGLKNLGSCTKFD